MKIVVFDLDETLGYFVQFGIFWESLYNYFFDNNYKLTQYDFINILDLYPEFLRPNIIVILNYLKHKKTSKCCDKLMIYTNNQGPQIWAKRIMEYFENKIKYKIFDQIIAAFKVNGERIEICRTSHDKSYNDLIKCTKLPAHAQICYLDDNFFPEMHNDNVYYINIKPYIYNIEPNEVLKRFIESNLLNEKIKDLSGFVRFILTRFKYYRYTYIKKTKTEYDIDKILSKQIMIHLQDFFYDNTTIKLNILHNNVNDKNTHKIHKITKNKMDNDKDKK